MRTVVQAVEALRLLPCGTHLLEVMEAHEGTWLVGGAVRDLLLGREPRELDVVVEGDAAAVARALGDVGTAHDRFGTYLVAHGGCAFDVVRARTERYVHPGALPDVESGTLEQDLARRDFSLNALALSARGELRAVPQGLEDLEARRLRVLHETSFHDDPTRLWRLVRYAIRLGATPEPRTDALAIEAVRAGAPATVSPQRMGRELRLALGEPEPLAVLHAAQNLGLVTGLSLDPRLIGDAVALLPVGGRADLTLLGAAGADADWGQTFALTAAESRVLERCAALEPVMPDRPSEVVRALAGEPVEAVAVAGARGDAETAGLYLHRWRHVALEIDGADLLAAGVPEGPEVGRRLAHVRALRLDGELAEGREAELQAALA